MNMLRRPRRFSTPVSVDVPTCSSASRVSAAVRPCWRPRAKLHVARRGAIGASRMPLRSISGIGKLELAHHAVGQLVVAVEAAPQPTAPGGKPAVGVQLERRTRGRRAPMPHGPTPSAAAPHAATRCSRRRRTTPPVPPPAPASARSRSVGATTSDEPGTMRRISLIRGRAFSMAMLPAEKMA